MKSLYFLPLLTVLLMGCSGEKKDAPRCATKEGCLSQECLCWCSQSCSYRKKMPEDNPVYVQNDTNGKSCYCKQWDVDYYEDNCILKKNVKEPETEDNE